MLWFNKRPTIEFHNVIEELDKISPIKKASHLFPDWWKNSNINEGQISLNGVGFTPGNIKMCPGILDSLKDGYIITAWTDIHIDPTNFGPTGDTCTISAAMESKLCAMHTFVQSTYKSFLPNYVNERYNHIVRIQTPWVVKTDPGYSVYILDPFYFFNNNFKCSPGILDTDIYHSISVQLMIENKEPFIIPFGAPLCIIKPFKRERYIFKSYSKNEKGDKLFSRSFFIKSCKFVETALYNFLRKKSKCPFS